MSRLRYLSVPLNEDGKREYDEGVENTVNVKVFDLPDQEFEFLYSKGVFKQINAECNLLIDDYESEIIKSLHIPKCKEIISLYNRQIDTFKEAINLAEKNKTFVGVDF